MARSFPGSTNTDNISVGSYVGTTLRSIACWFYVSALDVIGRRVYDAANTDLILMTSGANQLDYFVAWSGTDGDFHIAQPTTGVWHHLLITYDGGSTSNFPLMYLDGVAQTVTRVATPTGTIDNVSGAMVLGNNAASGGTRCFTGALAEFARWNRILSASEADALAKGFSPQLMPSGLLWYLPLIGRHSPEQDVLRGSVGTLTGTTAYPHPKLFRFSKPFPHDAGARFNPAWARQATRTIGMGAF